MALVWRKCSSCKTDIAVKSKYYACSVSTCNGKRTGLAFCSIPCFETHLPGARHKDAAAIEEIAPAIPFQTEAPKRRIVASKPSSSVPVKSSSSGRGGNHHEILVVVSKLKKYIQDSADMNTSQSVMSLLSDRLRLLCDEAVESARRDGRKTVMDRDFK